MVRGWETSFRYHPENKGDRKGAPRLAWIRSAITAFLMLALTVLLVAGCASSTPENVVRDFIRARLNSHERQAAELTVEGDLSEYLGGEPFMAGSVVSFDSETEEISNDRARVIVQFRWEQGEADVSYICRRVGSRWKVSLRETEEFRLPELKLLRDDENT